MQNLTKILFVATIGGVMIADATQEVQRRLRSGCPPTRDLPKERTMLRAG